MFTGLIEELGKVNSIRRGPNSAVIKISADMASDINIGDSIAVNGVCLTAVDKGAHYFEAEIMEETLKKTNLRRLSPGERVNLERALRVGDRLGGHLVSGHVDGMGIIADIYRKDIAEVFTITVEKEILHYLIPKGSISIDGISLTLVDVNENSFTVSLVPHTRKMTTLGFKKRGDLVNIEIDMLAKYVSVMLERINKSAGKNNKKDITIDFLLEKGFI